MADERQDWKTTVESMLEGTHPEFGRTVLFVLQGLILVSVLSIGIETLPNLPSWGRAGLAIEEAIIVAVFTVEYGLRLAIAPRPWRYALSFWGLVDLAAILPFYLSLGMDLRSARAFRLLRLFRLLKLTRYSRASQRMLSALNLVGAELALFGLVALIVLYLCAIGIYYFEHEAQPEAFASVFHSMWWAAVTLTTVGYGDVYPITLGGRIFTICVLILALGIVALPTGLLASALNRIRDEEPEEQKRRESPAAKKRKRKQRAS